MTETSDNDEMCLVLFRGQDPIWSMILKPTTSTFVRPTPAKPPEEPAKEVTAPAVPSPAPTPEPAIEATAEAVETKIEQEPADTPAPTATPAPKQPGDETFDAIVLEILDSGPMTFPALRERVNKKVSELTAHDDTPSYVEMKELYRLLTQMVKANTLAFSGGQYRKV